MSDCRKHSPKSEVTVRSSAAEDLTFVSATDDQSVAVEVRYGDEDISLTQKIVASPYGVTVQARRQYLKRIFNASELDQSAVLKQHLMTVPDGNRGGKTEP